MPVNVVLIDYMGGDKTPYNAARTSFDGADWSDVRAGVTDKQIKLIEFLAENNHWTPFGHPHVTLGIQAPIYTARQLMTSQVGFVASDEFVRSEVSRRYVSSEPTFTGPLEWRKAPEKAQDGVCRGVFSFPAGNHKYRF